jgi:hypothetical protein
VQVSGDDALPIGLNPPHLAPRIKSAPRDGMPPTVPPYGGCHSGDAALAAKEDQMPDYCPDASSADLFTADEELVS